MSIVSFDMIEKFAAHYGTSIEDGTEIPGIVGTLRGWEAGVGELDASLVDAEATREVFAPLRKAYFAAKGVEEPPVSQV